MFLATLFVYVALTGLSIWLCNVVWQHDSFLTVVLIIFFWLIGKMIPSLDRKWRGAEGWSVGWAVRT
jgi:hypothetical protein